MAVELVFRSLCDCSSQEVAAACRAIFADFVVPPPSHFDGVAFERRFRAAHLDWAVSKLVVSGDDPAAVILVARRGRTSHVSGLGVAPTYRHAGIARRLLSAACHDARDRGDKRVLVEVYTADSVARQLYESAGFRRRRQLLGFTKKVSDASSDKAVRETEPWFAAELMVKDGATDLPWFLHPASVCGCSLPTRAYELEQRAAIVVLPRGSELDLRAIFVSESDRGRGLARRLVQAAAFIHSTITYNVHPFVPNGLCDGFLAALGFERSNISNYEMELLLD